MVTAPARSAFRFSRDDGRFEEWRIDRARRRPVTRVGCSGSRQTAPRDGTTAVSHSTSAPTRWFCTISPHSGKTGNRADNRVKFGEELRRKPVGHPFLA